MTKLSQLLSLTEAAQPLQGFVINHAILSDLTKRKIPKLLEIISFLGIEASEAALEAVEDLISDSDIARWGDHEEIKPPLTTKDPESKPT